MAISQYVIQKITSQISISKYLQSKGIFPQRELSDGKSMYLCPIHKQDSPSFYLWKPNSGKLQLQYESYKCFGCKSCGNIINLYAQLQFGGSLKQAFKKLCGSADIEYCGQQQSQINRIVKQSSGHFFGHESIQSLGFKLSAIVKNHMRQNSILRNIGVEDDEQFSQKILCSIDNYQRQNDIQRLMDVHGFLRLQLIKRTKRLVMQAKNRRLKCQTQK